MSLNNASVQQGATETFSGGTALTFATLGPRENGNVLYAQDDSDIRTRREIVCKTVQATTNPDKPNGYTQSRSALTLKVPLSLDNGSVTVNTVRIEVSTDVETTELEKLALRQLALQVLSDSDFTEFWNNQSVV